MIVNYLKATNNINAITHLENNGDMHVPDFYQIVNRIVYPKWYHNLWQIKKPTSSTYHEVSKWFLDSNTPELLRWESSLWELERQLGSKWFNNNTVIDGLKGHISKLYKICDI